MSREDQVNPISYAIISIGSKFSFQESIPLESLGLICFNSFNKLLPYLGALELTIQGRGVLSQPLGMTPPQWVLQQFSLEPSWGQLATPYPIWQIGPLWCSMALWP
ncbi:hypothetical protein O181_076567 [Austropuccinia psidii MF-1]|uniref:Uncharacterized protein n=1 Tax=Austropuccinia psidii MF-1 TaxID=1389203 RepID=A0A9Q3FH38_9BASI|nr:hypothetical protein [Austropuccinia psidii MF-1]